MCRSQITTFYFHETFNQKFDFYFPLKNFEKGKFNSVMEFFPETSSDAQTSRCRIIGGLYIKYVRCHRGSVAVSNAYWTDFINILRYLYSIFLVFKAKKQKTRFDWIKIVIFSKTPLSYVVFSQFHWNLCSFPSSCFFSRKKSSIHFSECFWNCEFTYISN